MVKFSQTDFKARILKSSNPKIGVIALSTDFTIEQDFRRICHNQNVDIFVNRIPFENPLTQENYLKMVEITDLHLDNYDFFLKPAIKAQIDRAPDEQGLGRPERALIAIMKELNTKDFGAVFRLFCQREAIYSFGDLQVKKFIEDIQKG